MSEKPSITRAEAVRERREKQNAKRIARVQQEAARLIPAVTTRAKTAKRKPAQNTRRRFQIVFPTMPRSDTRLHPISIPRPRLGWRLLSFFLAALFGTAVYLALTMPQFRAGDIRVNGNQLMTPQEVSDTLAVIGQPIFLLKPADLEARLRLNYPELDSVKVTVYVPNVVIVNVSERQPLIRWEQDGGYTWVDPNGIAFRPRGEMQGLIAVSAVSAPPAAGGAVDPLTPAPFLPSQMVTALKALAPHVPQGTAILYDPSFGFGWNDARGWRVYFGTSAGDTELKVRVYESMVNSLSQRGIRPAIINVTYPEAPYYRMEP